MRLLPRPNAIKAAGPTCKVTSSAMTSVITISVITTVVTAKPVPLGTCTLELRMAFEKGSVLINATPFSGTTHSVIRHAQTKLAGSTTMIVVGLHTPTI